MNHFWLGFQTKQAARVPFKKHAVMLFWDPSHKGSKGLQDRAFAISKNYPSVQFRPINILKFPEVASKHRVKTVPTLILLRDGREVSRMSADEDISSMLLEDLFQRASVT